MRNFFCTTGIQSDMIKKTHMTLAKDRHLFPYRLHKNHVQSDLDLPRYDDYSTTAYYYLEKSAKLPFLLPEDPELVMT